MGNNIAIPYSGRIHGGIQNGTDVAISGTVPFHCNRFSLNLCIGPTYDQDCALHFNPRVSENRVVRNHMQGGAWGQEETSGGCPFRKGSAFNIHIKAHPHGYKITVNHRHFCDFNHRLPKESIQYLYIEGDVMINNIQFSGGHHPSYPSAPSFHPAPTPGYPPAPAYTQFPNYYHPAPSTSYYPTPTPGNAHVVYYPPSYPGAAGPIYNPPVPFTSPIQGGVVPGKIVFISGIPNPNPSRFTINMQCGPYDSGDFAMHLDVRFNYGNCRNQVVRTHKQSGNYGQEERDITHFPFMPNVPFEMMVLIEPTSFKIAVNNQHFVEFFHRIQPFNRADHINIVGDVRLTQIRFQ